MKTEQHIHLEASLQAYFNYSHFRQGQKEIIQDIMMGKNVLGILPTGSGKSLCYQLPAKLLTGSTIVVSPLISLMIDQVKELRAINYKEVIALNSFMEYKERKQVYRRLSSYKLIYLSPELLQQSEVLEYLRQINISLFVIDEAHCISQWGYEFRPDYLKFTSVIELLGNPPVLALSATATANVQKDIITTLDRPNMIKHIYPMDRENIAFSVQKVDTDKEKLTTIVKLLSDIEIPTLIYFSSRKSTELFSRILTDELPNQRIAFYHGGMDQMDRIAIQQQFMNNQLNVICCTSAFGMGINKANIRLVIHYHFPAQLESFIQEVGRAGRDGASSASLLFYSKNDEFLPRRMILSELPTEANLTFVFEQLSKLAIKKKTLPTNEHELQNTFQVNEIQWRFLHYQLEKNGIIDDNRIIVNRELWKLAFQTINNHRKTRLQLKNDKLTDIIQWMNEGECFRKHLYSGFQDSYQQPPTDQCCSNCGFSLAKWKPNHSIRKENKVMSWDNKLKALLLIGASDETK